MMNKRPSDQEVLEHMAGHEDAMPTDWWNRHFEMPPNRGMMMQFKHLVRAGYLSCHSKSLKVSKGYKMYWHLTKQGEHAAEHGVRVVRSTSELYGLLYRECFHPISLVARDDFSGDLELACGWSRRRALTHVV